MTPEELRDEYDLYALGLSEEPELSDLREHLRARPEEAKEQLRRSFAFVSRLPGLVEIKDPPQRLRGRVMAMVQPAQAKPLSVWGLVFGSTTAMLAALAGMLGYEMARVNGIRQADAARYAEAVTVLGAADTAEATFGPGARGKVFVNRNRGIVLIANQLDPLPKGKVYEMWVIPKGAKPVPAGLFVGRGDRSALNFQPGTYENVAAVAVTIENDGGAEQPTSTPILVAPVTP